MKRITLLITAVLLTCAASMAQTTSRWGITAGVNYNELHFKQKDIVPSTRMWGPQVGVTGEMNFSGIGFGVEGALLYTLKQGKVNYNRLGGFESTLMPLVYVGPQFSFLPYGNHKELNTYPPVNVYIDMGVGCEILERLQVRGGYNFSIGQSLHTKLLDDNIAKNRTWYVNLTWFLK